MDEFLKQLKAIDDAQDAILKNTDLTDEHRAQLAKLDADRLKVEERIALQKKADDRTASRVQLESEANARRLEADRREREAAIANRRTGAGAGTAAPVVRTDAEGRVTGTFEETDETINFRIGESADAVRQRSYLEAKRENIHTLKRMGYVPRNTFGSLADFVREGMANHSTPDFRRRCETHFGPLLDNRGMFLRPNAAVQGMSEGVGADGGYTVMPEFAAGIIDRVYSNDLWSRTDNYNVQGNGNTKQFRDARRSRLIGD